MPSRTTKVARILARPRPGLSAPSPARCLAAALAAVAAVAAVAALACPLPASAVAPLDERLPIPPYVPWSYPAQLAGGAIENGRTELGSDPGPGFLTLPFTGPHYVTSLFDHCHPDYVPDGRVCRFDGTVALAARGVDPAFSSGYAATRAGDDYLYYDGHDGIDYGLYYEPVLAAARGVVTTSGWFTPGCARCEFGRQVLIDHGNGFTTRYGHLSRILVQPGEAVARGQVIGISGNSGASSGAHLHFGVYVTATMTPIDPYGWSGAGADPWPHDAGDLWRSGSPRYPDGAVPAVTVTARSDPARPGRIAVAWSSAVPGSVFEVSVVEGQAAAVPWRQGVGAGSAVYDGAAGRSYWFLVSDRDPLGWTATGASRVATVPRFRFPIAGG